MTTTTHRYLSGQQVEDYHRDGFLHVRGLLTAQEVQLIRDTFMDQMKDGPIPGLSDIRPSFTRTDPLSRWPRMLHPHRHPDKPVGAVSMRYMLDGRVGDILRDIVAEEPIAAQSMFYFKPPGARGQDFHQDNFYLKVKPGTCLAAWFAIDDADRENGALVVAPGTHRMEIVCPEPADPAKFFTSEHVPLPPGAREELVEMKAGDCLFFHGALVHGSYPNCSATRFRRSFICHYAPASCTEIAKFYFPLYRFDGRETPRQVAQGGGPCGSDPDYGSITSPH